MTRMISFFLVFFMFSVAEGFDMNQIPDFQDGGRCWVLSSEGPLGAPFMGKQVRIPGVIGSPRINDIWGRGRNWLNTCDSGIVGTESFAYREREPFREEWGKVTKLRFKVAIRDRRGVWQIQTNGFPKLFPEIHDGKLIGVAVRFKTPNGESERYFPDPDYLR